MYSVTDTELEELIERWRVRANRHDDYRGINSCRNDLKDLLAKAQAKSLITTPEPLKVVEKR